MAEFTLTFTCDNAAFGDQPHEEIIRILLATAVKLKDGMRVMRGGIDSDPVRDANGNLIGQWEYKTS